MLNKLGRSTATWQSSALLQHLCRSRRGLRWRSTSLKISLLMTKSEWLLLVLALKASQMRSHASSRLNLISRLVIGFGFMAALIRLIFRAVNFHFQFLRFKTRTQVRRQNLSKWLYSTSIKAPSTCFLISTLWALVHQTLPMLKLGAPVLKTVRHLWWSSAFLRRLRATGFGQSTNHSRFKSTQVSTTQSKPTPPFWWAASW